MEPSPQPTPLPPLPVEAVHDLSMMGLILAADPIVQGVMVLLALSSVVCWAIILDKLFRVVGLRGQARMLESVAQAPTLARRPGETSGLAGAVCAVAQEAWADWTEGEESRAEYRDRLERAMRARVAEELRRVEPGLPFLATVGSAAPFVGLFGTVWGIMSSFTAIAQSNDTSLAVVAPGIAEALFATAIGLVAAIPAVVAYNKLSGATDRYANRLSSFADEFSVVLSRELDTAKVA
jgi:biopolymer transport protein TolQ